MKDKKIIKMLKSGELVFKVKEKLAVLHIKNNIIKNKQLQYREYCRLLKKYKKTIVNLKNKESSELKETSNKVWIFWFQGVENAPALVKKCIDSMKQNLKDKEIILLNKDNYKEYISFPNYIEEKFNKGIIPYAHFADLIRIELLAKYGGTWCDATIYMTGEVPNYITQSKLFVFKSIDLDRTDKPIMVASNWLLSACPNNNIIVATRDLLFEYWKKERFLTNYYIFHIFFKIVTDIYKEEFKQVPTFNNINPHILQFELFEEFDEKRFEQIKAMSTIHKLNRHIINENKDNFYEYILNN